MNQAKYAVIFTAQQSDDLEGYPEMQQVLRQEAEKIPGFCGMESIESNKREITISYWKSQDDIQAWRKNTAHTTAKSFARKWFTSFSLQITEIVN